jgi:RHS repeat-associated protein
VKIESALYKPCGEQSEWLPPGNAAPETKGWIGERFDADAGLQYLNARYYDPELSLFLQPDWFEVTKAGVGTNRFSYAFNDPVNKFDPGGNDAGPALDPDDWDDEKNPPIRTNRTAWQDIRDALAAGGGMTGALVYELSPAGAISNIYTGLWDGNYKQAALGVAEITPWGKVAGKIISKAANGASDVA